ncbi:MAG: THUMP domain-containing protein [Desulfurococcaceae archaeon TW002]
MFNLIVIHEPGPDNWRWARNQLRQLLGVEGRILTSYQSVMLYLVEGNPHQVAGKLRESLSGGGTPIIRIIPVDYVVDPYLDEVIEIVKNMVTKIPQNESFRITLQGRLMSVDSEGRKIVMHSMDSIKEIAKYIDRPVNLENPDWVVFIKIVKVMRGKKVAAVSLLKPHELINLRDLIQSGESGEEISE